MKLSKMTIVVDGVSADALPDLIAVGRGADPRGRDIEAWAREETARLRRFEAQRRTHEAAVPKTEAAE